MDEFEPVGREIQEDFEIEMTDLGLPDDIGSDRTARFAHAFLNWQRSLNRQHLRMGFVVCMGVLVVAVVIYNLSGYFSARLDSGQRPPASSSSFSYAAFDEPVAQQDGMACVTDNAWSPDSRQVAVLGNERGCSQVDHQPGLLNIYSTNSAQAVKHLHLDTLILRALNERPLSHYSLGLSVAYMHVLWSPDGQWLAVSFVDTDQPPQFLGVLLVDVNGKYARVLLQPYKAGNPFYAEWDVVRGRPLTLAPPPSSLVYHWGSGGKLIPQSLLASKVQPPAPPPVPVGSPDGGQSFTIWQPGLANSLPLKNGLVLFSFSTSFAAWSPDGRYFVEGINLEGLLEQHGKTVPSPQMLADNHVDEAPFLVAHDAALVKAVSALTVVAWSPDGRILATYIPGHAVNLYDAASGRKLISLSFPAPRVFLQGIIGVLRWSPDGSTLLLTSERWGTITVWHLGNLPK